VTSVPWHSGPVHALTPAVCRVPTFDEWMGTTPSGWQLAHTFETVVPGMWQREQLSLCTMATLEA
jgi:hypothetical protein